MRDDAGMTCLPRDVVRDMIIERDAKLEAEKAQRAQRHEESQRQRAEAQAQQRARQARAAAQRGLIEGGASAFAVMTAEDQEAKWQRASEMREDMYVTPKIRKGK